MRTVKQKRKIDRNDVSLNTFFSRKNNDWYGYRSALELNFLETSEFEKNIWLFKEKPAEIAKELEKELGINVIAAYDGMRLVF